MENHTVTKEEALALELQLFERQFSCLLENARLCSFFVDPSRKILVINSYLLARTGWTREELLGHDWTDVFLPVEHREKAKNIDLLLQNALIDSNFVELEFLTKAADRFRIALNMTPFKDSGGKIVGTAHVGEVVPSSVPSSPIVGRRRLSLTPETMDMSCTIPETVGDYDVHQPLGKDTGHVRLGVNRFNGERVAIKFMSKGKMTEQELERARREIVILQQLNELGNPHIVRLIHSLETETHIILIQEFVSGGELVAFMHKRQGLPEICALKLFKQLLSALECCHKRKVIHRDIKLQNIMLDENQNIKLIDFGVSNFIEDGVFRNTFCGTPAFASPEILLGEEYYGPEVDLWSIGVVLYFLLTAKYPFPNIGTILKGKYPEPGTLSPACSDLLRKLLTVNKEERITLEGVLNHPWVRLEEPQTKKRKTDSDDFLSSV